MSARFALKAATAQAHEQLDQLMSTFDLRDRSGYAAFLSAQGRVFPAVEQGLDAGDAATIVPDWPQRRRADHLAADLDALGIEVEPIADMTFDGPAAVLGALYVLEGSRLGGALLVRSVPDALPKSFLTPGNPAAWRSFVTLLDERLSSDADLATATRAAHAVFNAFRASALRTLGDDRP